MNFDEAYYKKFYSNEQTRATTPAEQARQAEFIAAYLKYLDVPVRRIVDLGCGMGVLLRSFSEAFGNAQCHGVEVSEYLCERFGWAQGSVLDYKDEPFDLVICTDVLGYLTDEECERAIENIATLTRHAAHISVITAQDMDICDVEHTDMRQHMRPVDWYRERLNQCFTNVGGRLFLKNPLEVAVWQLERGQ